MGLVGIVPERKLVGRGLGDVVELGAGTVGIDVHIVLLRVEEGLLEGDADTFGLGAAVRTRCGCVVGVAGAAVADHFGVYVGAALLGVLPFLEDEHCRAVSHHEAAAVEVERQGCVLGILLAGERLAVGEAGKSDRDGAMVGAACDDSVAEAVLHCPESLAEGVGRRRAGCHDIDAGTLRSELDGNLAGAHIANHSRHEVWRNPLAARVLQHLADLAVNGLEAADAGADIGAEAEGVDVLVSFKS